MEEEKKTQEITHIGMLIDAPIEVFNEAIKDYDFGTLTNVKKLLEGEYTKVEVTVNQLCDKLKNSSDEKESQTILASLDQLYIALQLIEDRCAIIEALKLETGVLN